MSDLVAMLDTSGRRLYNSPSYNAVFGDKDLAGTDSFREIHPEDRVGLVDLLHALFRVRLLGDGRMEFARRLAVGLLDGLRRRIARHA